MRLRPSHIAIIVVLGLTALVGAVALRQGQSPTVGTSLNRDEAFIESVRQRAETQASAGERGSLPGGAVGAQFVPVIDLGMEVFDGGTIPYDRHTVFELEVHNRGEGSLRITDIQTSCMACTLGRMASDEPIPAGRSGTLLITLKPEGIPGFESRQTLTIHTNDPRRPRIFLPVHVTVVPEFELAPMELDFGTVTAGERVTRTMYFRTLQDAPIELADITWVPYGENRLNYSFTTTPPGSWTRPNYPEYEITVTLRENALPGRNWTEYFLLHNTTDRLTRFRVQATGTVLPAGGS